MSGAVEPRAYEVPGELAAEFTPNEADELSALFQSADEDGSGTIDEVEFKRLLVNMDIQVSDEEADKLVMAVDSNNNGLIEWSEFVVMVLQAKRGDQRYEKLKVLAESLKMTPVNLLEAEAEKFHMNVEFKLVEERKATMYNPKTYVVSVTIATPHDGGLVETYEAIGFSSREAKFKAAELALVKMKKMKPGYEFAVGVVPPVWDNWAITNLNKGVKATKVRVRARRTSPASAQVLGILVDKGFSPAKNLAFMKRLSVRLTTRRLQKEAPLVTSNTGLPSQWLRWIDDQLARGMDGALLLQELQLHGFDPTKDLRTTQFLTRHPPSETGYDFWSCLAAGDFHEVNLFVAGGHDVDEERMDRRSQIAYTPLQFASKLGFLSIVEFLLLHGAKVDAVNSFRRTALMFAARHGHPGVVKVLLAAGASIFLTDNFANTALHMAAIAGCARSARELLVHEDNYMRSCVVNTNSQLNFLDETRTFRSALQDLYVETMELKLPRNVYRRFEKKWIPDTVDRAYEKIFGKAGLPAIKPSSEVIRRVLERWNYLQGIAPAALDDIELQRIAEATAGGVHNATHLQIYLENMFKDAYKNAPNRQGRTALHLACEENLVCSHEAVLRVLLDTFGCDPHIRDNLGQTPLDLLLHRKGRPGSPTEDKPSEDGVRATRRARREANETRRREARDAANRTQFETELLRQLPTHPETNDIDLTVVKGRSHVQAEIAGWREYLDPESLNPFYEHLDSGRLTLVMPDAVKTAMQKKFQWYKRRSMGRILEKRESWSMHRDNRRARVFFYNHDTGEYQWQKPERVDGWVNTPPNFQAKSLDEDDSDDDDDGDVAELQKREQLHEVSERLLRRLGAWEEHKDAATGGRIYYHTTTGQLTREKPDEVEKEELKRQAYALLVKTAQFIDRMGEWDKYEDPTTQHVFYHNRITGEGRHESEANEAAFRAAAMTPSEGHRRLSSVEIAKRKEHAEWLEALQRARRKEIHTTVDRPVPIDDATRRMTLLTDSLLLQIGEDFATYSVGYRDARIETETRVLVKARALGLFVSRKIVKPVTEASDAALEVAGWAEDDEAESAAIEKLDRHPSIAERRRVERVVEAALARMDQRFALCFWGCHLWVRLGVDLDNHEHDECRRRCVVFRDEFVRDKRCSIMLCRLGCTVFHETIEWQKSRGNLGEISWHEMHECATRLIKCPRDCGMWVALDQVDVHSNERCVRRPVSGLMCRLGCGQLFEGENNQILELEHDRSWHEAEDCPLRIVKCMWPGCQETMLAKERKLHRRTHLCASGITTFKTAGNYDFVVPKEVKHIKVQAWGAGGGSGVLHGFKFGHGGGGAFVEGICPVHPGETLLLVVGGGGQAGVFGETAPSDTESGLPLLTRIGEALGGIPGGGAGYSGNNEWACGGGGGYTSMTRKGPHGLIPLFVVGGGGGGGCRDGLGGGGLHAEDRGEKSDMRNGRLGSQTRGGVAGQCSKENISCAFAATSGAAYQGGNGAEFGGGGGGGYFGGGGGGFSPGIVGGGGGGSSYIDKECFANVHVERSYKRVPGARERHPPAMLSGGVAGEGGYGELTSVCSGNDGCIRIAIPGFYSDMDFDSEDATMRHES
ncbi:hypothetical protein ACHHYP_05368 [Achlya hypogyna]|uniref:receptor protein-tyrosine kinase n=1 Tax=Achlya hypogyna TaxID=1202772 RepID=A0A1V9YY24_ACHHY|nr:hypothetical protein ACHHYP_05368 [Achlya hypogyna]